MSVAAWSAHSAHPRSRGENLVEKPNVVAGLGSSPLTRGKPAATETDAGIERLIPAHAGKTPTCHPAASRYPAHPRSRGENSGDVTDAAGGRGSSPLTRGKLRSNLGIRGASGLIPAHAGKTREASPGADPTWAHPRSRGENLSRPRGWGKSPGSSPLTRGKLQRRQGDRNTVRLIPAHAGKTRRPPNRGCSHRAHPRSRGENTDGPYGVVPRFGSSPLTRGKRLDEPGPAPPQMAHPRSRGENSFARPLKARENGSSPLTRGKPPDGHADACRTGLIPAHAGKTSFWRTASARARAHPRSRGENAIVGRPVALMRGSSPLTRGKRRADPVHAPRGRLIPAHAGKTARTDMTRARPRAHPRSRGENTDGLWNATAIGGSSPLTRGKPGAGGDDGVNARLIPAHAGKTGEHVGSAPGDAAHPRSRGEN